MHLTYFRYKATASRNISVQPHVQLSDKVHIYFAFPVMDIIRFLVLNVFKELFCTMCYNVCLLQPLLLHPLCIQMCLAPRLYQDMI